jgi:hypothetical protein
VRRTDVAAEDDRSELLDRVLARLAEMSDDECVELERVLELLAAGPPPSRHRRPLPAGLLTLGEQD